MSLDTFMSEWEDFDRRNRDHAHLGLGGLTWGFMRAIAECPNCPGHFRTAVGPEGDEWRYLRCSHCGEVWEWREPDPASAKPNGRKRKSGRGM